MTLSKFLFEQKRRTDLFMLPFVILTSEKRVSQRRWVRCLVKVDTGLRSKNSLSLHFLLRYKVEVLCLTIIMSALFHSR